MAWVAADRDRHGARFQDLAHGLLGASHMGRTVVDVVGDVADVHDLDVAAVIDRPSDVEVVTLETSADSIRHRPDRIRRLDLIIRDRVRLVGATERNAQNGDVRVECIEVGADRRVEKALMAELRGQSERQRHDGSNRSKNVRYGAEIGTR